MRARHPPIGERQHETAGSPVPDADGLMYVAAAELNLVDAVQPMSRRGACRVIGVHHDEEERRLDRSCEDGSDLL
ncbi:MAG TPA: hypothetical protein VHE30_22680 [Polyangiaceae bacterium]|nr:hypothetical protein [Polyangiaceae bacterium]